MFRVECNLYFFSVAEKIKTYSFRMRRRRKEKGGQTNGGTDSGQAGEIGISPSKNQSVSPIDTDNKQPGPEKS